MEITEGNVYDRLKPENKAKLDVLSNSMPTEIQSIISELKCNINVLHLKFGTIIELQNHLQPTTFIRDNIFKLFVD